MNILESLRQGKKLLFYHMDVDTWSYNETAGTLEQWINGEKTGMLLTVNSVDKNQITASLGDEVFTLLSQYAVFVD